MISDMITETFSDTFRRGVENRYFDFDQFRVSKISSFHIQVGLIYSNLRVNVRLTLFCYKPSFFFMEIMDIIR